MQIIGPAELESFREHLNGDAFLDTLSKHQYTVVNISLGVGKSHCIDSIITKEIAEGDYDLIVTLSPTRKIIDERRAVKFPPKTIKVVNLKPRPAKNCGEDSNRCWKPHERNNRGALGRHEICSTCPNAKNCSWLAQYGNNMKGTRLLFATQAHLKRDPLFLIKIVGWTGAKKVLALIDESNFIMNSCDTLKLIS